MRAAGQKREAQGDVGSRILALGNMHGAVV